MEGLGCDLVHAGFWGSVCCRLPVAEYLLFSVKMAELSPPLCQCFQDGAGRGASPSDRQLVGGCRRSDGTQTSSLLHVVHNVRKRFQRG